MTCRRRRDRHDSRPVARRGLRAWLSAADSLAAVLPAGRSVDVPDDWWVFVERGPTARLSAGCVDLYDSAVLCRQGSWRVPLRWDGLRGPYGDSDIAATLRVDLTIAAPSTRTAIALFRDAATNGAKSNAIVTVDTRALATRIASELEHDVAQCVQKRGWSGDRLWFAADGLLRESLESLLFGLGLELERVRSERVSSTVLAELRDQRARVERIRSRHRHERTVEDMARARDQERSRLRAERVAEVMRERLAHAASTDAEALAREVARARCIVSATRDLDASEREIVVDRWLGDPRRRLLDVDEVLCWIAGSRVNYRSDLSPVTTRDSMLHSISAPPELGCLRSFNVTRDGLAVGGQGGVACWAVTSSQPGTDRVRVALVSGACDRHGVNGINGIVAARGRLFATHSRLGLGIAVAGDSLCFSLPAGSGSTRALTRLGDGRIVFARGCDLFAIEPLREDEAPQRDVQARWLARIGGSVTALAAADDRGAIMVGTREGRLFITGRDGWWSVPFRASHAICQIEPVASDSVGSADRAGQSFLIGCRDRAVHWIDARGTRLETFVAPTPVSWVACGKRGVFAVADHGHSLVGWSWSDVGSAPSGVPARMRDLLTARSHGLALAPIDSLPRPMAPSIVAQDRGKGGMS